MVKPLTRRSVLGITAALPLAGCLDDVNEALNMGEIQSAEWTAGGTLVVTFQENHDADFVALVHEYDDTPIWSGNAPRFSGPIDIPAYKAISCDDSEYPTNNFELVAGIGYPNIGVVEEILHRYKLEISDERLTQARGTSVTMGDCFGY